MLGKILRTVHSFTDAIGTGRDAVTEIVPVDLNAVTQSVRRSILTKEQVFRLWRCAIRDDDRLVDEVIQHAYEGMIAFDCGRAEFVMGLTIRRHMAAGRELRTLLEDMRAVNKASRIDCCHNGRG
jgi:hypothetical protein